jgi:hypothetical protein
MLDNPTIEVVSIDELDEWTILISYVRKREFVEEAVFSNIAVSLWTTSAARLHLLRFMQRVVRSPGCKLLYTGKLIFIIRNNVCVLYTDSLIFLCPKGKCPLETGPHLGDLR